jgi:membrane glycosyltransferase
MFSNLAEVESHHNYDLFVLSDTNESELIEEEQAAFLAARELLEADWPLYYRRRGQNSNRKVGNIADWICRWGGDYEAFLVLDADSVMSAQAIHALTDELARDETLGLVQSAPRIIGARTLFGRIQQLSSATVGPVVAAGASTWMGAEANYFGHNAIVRTRAFAASANLPALPGRPPFGGNILSHDFVEAAMLRRAGWGIRPMPLKDGSYEETPPSLIDYVLRDRRWCQGNLQHLLVLASAGFHPLSRFHLLQGIMAYLVSPFWALFLLFGVASHTQGEGYPGDAALFIAASEAKRGLAVLMGTLLILIAPKFIGAASLAVVDEVQRYGSRLKLFASTLVEVVLMSLLAPILMVQQTIAVLRVFLGIDGGWHPQRREATELSWFEYGRFHLAETVIGALLVICIVAGLFTYWLLPVALSLLFAAPLSRLSSVPFGEAWEQPLLFATPKDVVQPAILAQSRRYAQGISERIGPGATPPQMLQAAE